jgi:uncharacterized protein (UPF0332 family)
MLSPTVERKARSHLRLADGLIKTAEINDDASEFEIRNAFSRAYYALFHVCCAHLLASGTDATKAEEITRDHGRLHSTIRRPIGRLFERFVREAYDRRRQADYEPGWPVPSATVAQGELKRARTQFYWLFNMTRQSLDRRPAEQLR